MQTVLLLLLHMRQMCSHPAFIKTTLDEEVKVLNVKILKSQHAIIYGNLDLLSMANA